MNNEHAQKLHIVMYRYFQNIYLITKAALHKKLNYQHKKQAIMVSLYKQHVIMVSLKKDPFPLNNSLAKKCILEKNICLVFVYTIYTYYLQNYMYIHITSEVCPMPMNGGGPFIAFCYVFKCKYIWWAEANTLWHIWANIYMYEYSECAIIHVVRYHYRP